MLALMMKLMSILLPFLKELLLGNKKIKKHERNINFFLLFGIVIIFLLLLVSNVTNSKLVIKLKDAEAKILTLKEENKILGLANDNITIGFNDKMKELTNCINDKDAYFAKIEELENLDCEEMKKSLVNKVINIQNGKCELNKINLRHDMPMLPTLSKTLNNDAVVGDILIKYVTDLRKFITAEDILIEEQKNNCK